MLTPSSSQPSGIAATNLPILHMIKINLLKDTRSDSGGLDLKPAKGLASKSGFLSFCMYPDLLEELG